MSEGFVLEPQRQTQVLTEADVAVVGGGPAGLVAALAAARSGAQVVLVERYGYVGGMATGGLVILLDSMGNDTGRQVIKGITQEIVDRLAAYQDGVMYPPSEEWGGTNPDMVRDWKYCGAVTGSHVRYSPAIHPEYFKAVGNQLLDEAGVETLFHAWACAPIMEESQVRGIILESKSGRLAVKAKVTVDCTGDGDIFAGAGAAFSNDSFPMGVIFRVAGVNTKKAIQYAEEHPEKMKSLRRDLTARGGIKGGIIEQNVAPGGTFMRTTVDSMVWFNNSRAHLDALNLKHLTQVEKEIRQQMLITVDFFRRHVPGFENSFLVDTAPQVGVRSSRRLQGQYTLTRDDMLQGTVFPDVVTTCASGIDGRPLINIPYRCFLPPKINGLLVAGRCISTDFVTQTIVRIIPSCMAMGQAMGTAAALAAREGIPPAEVDVLQLQTVLTDDGLYLNRPNQYTEPGEPQV